MNLLIILVASLSLGSFAHCGKCGAGESAEDHAKHAQHKLEEHKHEHGEHAHDMKKKIVKKGEAIKADTKMKMNDAADKMKVKINK